jgi:hypothetical protein
MHEDPGMDFAFVFYLRFSDEVMLKFLVLTSELYPICRASGVNFISRPLPSN